MTDPLLESLKEYKNRVGHPLKVLFVNTGGTFTCVPNKDGLLEPLQSESGLKTLITDGLNLNVFIKRGLLKVRILHLFTVDSSQMEDVERDEIVKALHPEYTDTAGVIVIHGTDTGADTAKFLHLALPYYDPRTIWKDQNRMFNWAKPVLILSSQVPAVDVIDGKLTYRIDSDGPMNLSLALMILADGKIGEAGVITNNGDALRGPACEKGAEVDIPPYRTDPGAPPIARYTALGIRYLPQGFLQCVSEDGTFVPFIIHGAAGYGERVLTVFESSHLNVLREYLRVDGETKRLLQKALPEVIIYVSKGAGNVMKKDYDLLKSAEKEGIVAFRVPLPGGRIPTQQLYNVPGHEIPALNMQSQTARYKAMMVLHLAEKVFKIQKAKRKEFIHTLMRASWGNEFLPRR